jgi:hypothetical protein
MDCRIKSGNDLVPSLLRWSQKDAGAFGVVIHKLDRRFALSPIGAGPKM